MSNTTSSRIARNSFQVFLFVFFSLIATDSLKSQNVTWAFGFGNTGSDQGYDISTDSTGNVYVTGWFSGTIQLGGQTLTSSGQQDIFVACFDNMGTLNWLRQAGGPSNDVSASIVTTPSGESYITGWFSGTCDFDDSLVVSNGSLDMFVAKYDASGTIRWVRHGGGPLDDYGNRLALSLEGGVTLAGSFKDTLDADGLQLVSLGNRDALLCHYDSDGQIVWVHGVGGAGEDRAYGIIQSVDSSYFFTGMFTGNVSFGAVQLTCNSFFGTYVAALDLHGSPLWAVKADAGANDFSRGFGIERDQQGNVYVNGYFSGSLRIGAATLVASGGQYDIDAFLFKLTPAGSLVWARKDGGDGNDEAQDMCINATGEIVSIGFFADSARFSPFTISSAGLSDLFIARYDTAGNLIAVNGYGGTGNEYGYGITGDAVGNLFMTGVFTGSSLFGTYSFTTAGGNDAFIAAVGPSASGVQEIGSGGLLFVHPNPVHDRLFLGSRLVSGLSKDAELRFTDMTGRTVLSRDMSDGTMDIDVSMLTPGPYIVRWISSGVSYTCRVVVQ
ncbi:MAG: hypothetical protein RL213_244 [Bacteroidota bacterium]|jgi:hypothetical protein